MGLDRDCSTRGESALVRNWTLLQSPYKCIQVEPDTPVQIISAQFMSTILCILAGTSFC